MFPKILKWHVYTIYIHGNQTNNNFVLLSPAGYYHDFETFMKRQDQPDYETAGDRDRDRDRAVSQLFSNRGEWRGSREKSKKYYNERK